MIRSAVEFKKVGDLLRERRMQKDLSLDEISKITRIRKAYLEALESGDYSIFNSDVYIRGFLKNYSKYLGLDPEKVLAIFRRENEVRPEDSALNSNQQVITKSFRLNLTPTKIVTSGVIAAVLGVILYVATNVSAIFAAPELTLTLPTQTTAGSDADFETTLSEVTIEGEVEPGSTLTINEQRLQTNNFERYSTKLTLSEGINRFEIKAASQFGKTSVINLTVFKLRSDDVPPADTVQLMQLKIDVVTSDAFISVKADGTELADRIFAVGEKFEVSANTELEITSPRPESLFITINGEVQTLNTTLPVIFSLDQGVVISR